MGQQNIHTESIYDLIPKEVQQKQRPPRYVSKYPSETPPTGSTFGRSKATAVMTTNLAGDYSSQPRNHRWKEDGGNFGKNLNHYSDPTNYLKKNTKTNLPDPKAFAYQKTSVRKPAVVRKDEKPMMGRRSNKNFIKENALANIMAEPRRKTVPEMDYMSKADYGKVPKYLDNVKQEISAEQEYIQACLEAEQEMYQQQQPQMQLMDESERVKLLNALKQKWEVVQRSYQMSTHIVTLDTIGKVRRKEEFENNLQQLEKAIEKISKPFVFIQEGSYDHLVY